MIIRYNLAALTAFNNIERNAVTTKKAAQAIATGQRINSAADDAAGLAISERMRAQINGLNNAVKNTQDGISLLQTAEGALSSTTSILQRMRELSVQAANDTLTSQDRNYIQAEIEQLKDEINNISNTTQFNKKKLLNGDSAALWSSSDNNLKAIINGSLVSTDQFGQKVNSEGNYKIEITSDPGKAQVQKSNIFDVEYVDESATLTPISHTRTETHQFEININDGVDSLGRSSGEGWNYSGGVLTFTADGTYSVVGKLDGSGNQIATRNYIKVNPGVNANIFYGMSTFKQIISHSR